MTSEHNLSPQEYMNLMDRVAHGMAGTETVFECNGHNDDHLHVRRLGDIGDRDDGRLGVLGHQVDGQSALVVLHASEARRLAAAILNIADELDGIPPLKSMTMEV